MASLSAESWPAIVSAYETAAAVLAEVPLREVSIGAEGRAVVVAATPIVGRADTAWAICCALRGLWAAELVPADVSLVVRLSRVSYTTSGAMVTETDRRTWSHRVEVRIG